MEIYTENKMNFVIYKQTNILNQIFAENRTEN